MLQWIAAGYGLGFALWLITAVRLGGMFGRKRTFLLSVAGFTAASALCRAAKDPAQLIAARAVVLPVLPIIQVMLAPKERGAAIGTLSSPHRYHGGRRSAAVLNVDQEVAGQPSPLDAGTRYVPESRALDEVGVLLVMPGLLLLIYPRITGREHGWPA